MHKALDSIKTYLKNQQSNGQTSGDGSVEDFEDIEILPTDLYVRFLIRPSQYTDRYFDIHPNSVQTKE